MLRIHCKITTKTRPWTCRFPCNMWTRKVHICECDDMFISKNILLPHACVMLVYFWIMFNTYQQYMYIYIIWAVWWRLFIYLHITSIQEIETGKHVYANKLAHVNTFMSSKYLYVWELARCEPREGMDLWLCPEGNNICSQNQKTQCEQTNMDPQTASFTGTSSFYFNNRLLPLAKSLRHIHLTHPCPASSSHFWRCWPYVTPLNATRNPRTISNDKIAVGSALGRNSILASRFLCWHLLLDWSLLRAHHPPTPGILVWEHEYARIL